jgi:hypothetical protein
MSTNPIEVLRFDAENAAARLRGEKLSVANMLCFSSTVDIFHFLNSSGSGNRAYIMRPQIFLDKKNEDEKI